MLISMKYLHVWYLDLQTENKVSIQSILIVI